MNSQGKYDNSYFADTYSIYGPISLKYVHFTQSLQYLFYKLSARTIYHVVFLDAFRRCHCSDVYNIVVN